SGKLQPKIDVVSTLDVIVLRDSADAPPAQEQPERGWAVRIWSGRIDGDKVAWDGEAPTALPATGADRILLLRLGAVQVAGETAPWLRVADAVTPRSTPTYALLPAPDDARLLSWNHALTHTGETGRVGKAVVPVSPEESTTDLALRLAIDAPTGDEDLAL